MLDEFDADGYVDKASRSVQPYVSHRHVLEAKAASPNLKLGGSSQNFHAPKINRFSQDFTFI